MLCVFVLNPMREMKEVLLRIDFLIIQGNVKDAQERSSL